jgi:hypothetical protein
MKAVVQFLFEKMSLAARVKKRRQGLGFLSTNSSSPYSDQPVKQHACTDDRKALAARIDFMTLMMKKPSTVLYLLDGFLFSISFIMDSPTIPLHV